MSLTPGSRLGPYEIVAALGAGGMGEVYRARDPRLGREVAIKVLPDELSSDRDRLARFEQEARSASALNHPSIVTIYEIGRAGETAYISMELVSGRTLRELLADGALPVRRLLPLAGQMADGLARAHEAGIVHRDLKPENAIVTRDGHVKILDFGLAKLVPHAGSDASQVPTAIEPTRPGIVLGTVGYMSPEQASGRPLDFRSDQFSFGTILYEMATGRRAFSRETAAETLAAVIRDEPEPLRSLAPQVPIALRWVIERCLAKDPNERYASTRDLARDVAHIKEHITEVSGETASAIPSKRRGLRAPLLAAGSLLLGALAALAILRGRREPPRPAVRFSVSPPAGTTYAPGEISRGIAISPDGTRLVIEAISRGRRRLYIRPLDSEDATELEGSLDATSPFWSPDGRFLAFFADGKLKKIPAAGGEPQELCDAPLSFVGTWSPDGVILFAKLDPPGIYRVSDAGGEAQRIVSPDPSRGLVNIWPYFLPDGRRFLYLATGLPGSGHPELRVASLDGKENRAVAPMASRVEYAAPGYLLYVREGALFAQPFDAGGARLRGEPRRVASGAYYFYGPAHAPFSVSTTGILAYQTAPDSSRLAWLDRSGKVLGSLGPPAVLKGFRISPDGSKAAVAVENPKWGTCDIWVYELARGVSTRLQADAVDQVRPVWSSDGSTIFYRCDRDGPPDIFQLSIGVPGSERPLLQLPGVQQPEDASQDGRLLVYLQDLATTVGIRLLPLDGGKPIAWPPTRFSQTSPRFSPDGRWIAYESDETGQPEVYVALADGGGEKRRVSPGGGRLPRWRRDGKELLYVATGGTVMAVAVTPEPRWEAGAPAPLFRAESEIEDWDVAADGSRFLVSLPAEKSRESPLRVIAGWRQLLKEP
jgi:eukaryotic-like serine/threonine-protein kinase